MSLGVERLTRDLIHNPGHSGVLWLERDSGPHQSRMLLVTDTYQRDSSSIQLTLPRSLGCAWHYLTRYMSIYCLFSVVGSERAEGQKSSVLAK